MVRPARIVVVDNDPDAVELVVADLGRAGHDVVGTAPDADAGLDLCERAHPDVAVVDYRMAPGDNGIVLAGELRRRSLVGAIVLSTNYQSAAIVAAAERAGAVVVAKGNIRRLRAVVAEEAGRVRGQRERPGGASRSGSAHE